MSAPGETIRVVVATGSRAEFGLLAPVMRAVDAHGSLELQVIVAGSHLLGPDETWREVAEQFEISATVEMQRAGETGRLADAAALGRGVSGFAAALAELAPDWLVALGDRVEAFAGAAAASVGGVRVAHIHGGDRAEGVADEAMRHAITKLAHLHLAATQGSAERIVRMGEAPESVHVVGSPAIDALAETPALDDAGFEALGAPEIVVLMHPTGAEEETERRRLGVVLEAVAGRRVLALHPNFDPGRDGMMAALRAAKGAGRLAARSHLPRAVFVGLLKRLASAGGALVGNSSAALIEAAALRLPAVDLGARQSGRERAGNVVHCDGDSAGEVQAALRRALAVDRASIRNPYGDGRSGERIAAMLASPEAARISVRKRNSY